MDNFQSFVYLFLAANQEGANSQRYLRLSHANHDRRMKAYQLRLADLACDRCFQLDITRFNLLDTMSSNDRLRCHIWEDSQLY